ncbi:MAG TPA: hypothetical protein VGA44_09585 [Steroidobacteraceae bacterium]
MAKWKNWNAGTVLLMLASAVGAEPSAPPAASVPLPPCVAADAFTPICGLHAPEDLDTLDESRLLVVQMRGMTGTDDSNLAVLSVASGDVRVLPVRPSAGTPAWGDASCMKPDSRPGLHGFDRWIEADGKVRVLVVNHGTRSSIERYRLDRDDSGELLAWEGCVLVPADIELNDVAALPGGGFAATVMGEARHFGNDVGLFYAAWTGRRILKYDRDAKAIGARADLDYLPDNLSWSPDGTIAGPARVLGGASVAVRIGEAHYVSAFSGDRILRIPTDAK